MLFHKDILRIQEVRNIRLSDATLIKLEDATRNRQELLVTIAASHYGMLNNNAVVYRHDTVKNNIGTFIHPSPKPIIENHRPRTSKKFGSIIAVDYKMTDFYNELGKEWELEGLTTEEYLNLVNDVIIPYQKKNKLYDGLGFCETVGVINDKDGIKRIIDKEYLTVSIGADPKRLICSNCLQDQVEDICDHFSSRRASGIYMLAEELEYEELSLLNNKKAADPHGKITKIHDGQVEEFEYEVDENLIVDIDFIDKRDFFKLADETKTIVCCDNICKIVNREEVMAKKKDDKKVVSLSYVEEFGEKLNEIKIQDAELTEDGKRKLVLADDMEDSQFAIVQKTQDEIKRRFPLHDELNVRMAVELLDSAEDLTPSEITKAQASITKAAKKLGIEVEFKKAEEKKDDKLEDTEKLEDGDGSIKTVEEVISELKSMLEAIGEAKLTDTDESNPISLVFDMLASISASSDILVTRAKAMLVDSEELVDKSILVALQDELTEAKEQIDLLEDLNRDLNVQIRSSLVDEIVDAKEILGLLKDNIEDEKKELLSHPYNVLVKQVSDFRQLKAKFNTTEVNNNKEKENIDIKSVKDPTLQDAVDEEVVVDPDKKLEDDEKPRYSETDIKMLFRKMFTK
jgi:hypothetical protein